MDDNMKICALVRQTWYEAAKRNLSDSERLLLYELCFDYQFYNQEPTRTDKAFSAVFAMFDLIAPILNEDRKKAINIIERNRRNARAKQSNSTAQEVTEPNGSIWETKTNQTQPNENLGQQYTNTLHNTTQQLTNVFNANANRKKDTKEEIYKLFFEMGAKNPREEVDKFWNYYEARGWSLPNSGIIRSKYAVAKTWRIENSDAELKQIRAFWLKICELSAKHGYNMPFILTERFQYIEIKRNAKRMDFYFNGQDIAEEVEKARHYIELWAFENYQYETHITINKTIF